MIRPSILKLLNTPSTRRQFCKSKRRRLSSSSLADKYLALTKNQDVRNDRHQLEALGELERLRKDLLSMPPVEAPPKVSPLKESSSSSSSFLGGWFSGQASSSVEPDPPQQATKAPKGVYLHGGVGCGKTFLMNLFYDSITEGPWAQDKQQVHFHQFLLRVHQEMHAARTGAKGDSDAILPATIESTLKHGRLICFDEFQVVDVADAMILQRLFSGLWERGCVVVATSNRPPDDLYLNGLQRDRFLPFIDLLKEKCEIRSMEESETDYRLVQKELSDGQAKVYFQASDGRKEFDELFYNFVETAAVAPTSLQTQGRKVKIPQAALSKGVARFSFEDICQKALGAADYLVIGEYFDTVFVERVPVLSLTEINWVRRFITFIDAMYECHVKLILHAEVPAYEIFQPGVGNENHDEVFAFDRTVSRLEEMSSAKYLTSPWIGGSATKRTEGKAALLSRQKATLFLEPSLGDEKAERY